MKYLICEYCGFKNFIKYKCVLFCDECNKKIKNNYLDWKITTQNADYNLYIEQLPNAEEVLEIRATSVRKKYDVNLIILFLILFLILLFFYLEPSKSMNEVTRWNNKTIFNEIKISLPFKIDSCSSILPYYLFQYVKKINSYKSECDAKISISIEEIEFSPSISLTHENLSKIYNEDMQSPYIEFTVEKPAMILSIKNYIVRIDEGRYMRDGSLFYYENYSFLKKQKVIKIIVSYDSVDSLAVLYNNVIRSSIMKNMN